MFVKILRLVKNGSTIEKSYECEGYEVTRCERDGTKYLTIELRPRGELFALDEKPGNEVYIMTSKGETYEIYRYSQESGGLSCRRARH